MNGRGRFFLPSRRASSGWLISFVLALFVSGCSQNVIKTVVVTQFIDREEATQAAATRVISPAATPTPRPPEEQDILSLVDAGSIQVEVRGSSIDEVGLNLRRLEDEDISVLIPAGTFFVSGDSSAQNMVSRRPIQVTLTDNAWRQIQVPAACANMELSVPHEGTAFSIQSSPSQFELELLMAELEKAGLDYIVEQAAIWIVTDDATYADLGTLVGGFGFGSRLILEADAARAMKAVDEAGIDITRKAIWADRDHILAAVDEPELAAWLQDRENQVSPPLVEGAEDELGLVVSYGEPLYRVAYSPLGDKIAATTCQIADHQCAGGSVHIWDAQTGEKLIELSGHTEGPFGLAWSADGEKLASGACRERNEAHNCLSSEIMIWDVSSGQRINSILAGSSWLEDLVFTIDGTRLAASQCLDPGDTFFSCGTSEIFLWEVASGQVLKSFGNSPYRFTLAYAPNADIAAVVNDDKIAIWDIAASSEIQTIPGNFEGVQEIKWSPDGDFFAAIVNLNEIWVWEAASGQMVGQHILDPEAGTEITDLDWGPGASFLAAAACHSRNDNYDCISADVYLFDTSALGAYSPGDPIDFVLLSEIQELAAWDIEISPSGDRMAVILDEGDVLRIVDLEGLP